MGNSFIQKLFGKANIAAVAEPVSTALPQSVSMLPKADTLRPPRYLRPNVNRQAIAELRALFEEEAVMNAPLQIAPFKSEPLIVVPSPVEPQQRAVQRSLQSPEELGRFVREKRKSVGMSQRMLCEKANVGARFMVELEAGKHTLEIGKVLLVLAALMVDLTVT